MRVVVWLSSGLPNRLLKWNTTQVTSFLPGRHEPILLPLSPLLSLTPTSWPGMDKGC